MSDAEAYQRSMGPLPGSQPQGGQGQQNWQQNNAQQGEQNWQAQRGFPTSMQGQQDGRMGGQPRSQYSGAAQPQERQSQYRPSPQTSQQPNPPGQRPFETRKPTPMGS